MRWSGRKKRLSKEELSTKLAEIQHLQNQHHLDVVAIKVLEEEIASWMEHEELKWKQRAKQDWYKMGGKNTKYFHACPIPKHKK